MTDIETTLAAIRERADRELVGLPEPTWTPGRDTLRLLDAVEAALKLHREYRIYHDCDHDEPHTEQERDDGFVFDADDIGETCERSYQYSI